MNRTAIGSVTGAVLIGALLLRIPTPSTRSASEGRRTQQSATLTQSIQPKAGKELPEDGPWKASQDYFGPARSDREDCLPAETSGNRQNVVATQRGGRIRINNLRDQLWCIPHDVTVQAMIATIPDPVHTRLPLVFDRSIEAIQLAAQAMNYAPDRYWLPWNPQGEPEWNNYDSRQKAEQDIEEKEKQPGVLMFRWDGKNHEALAQVLYVFLVAETPTTGINGQQFRNAVDYVQVLCSNVGAAGCASWDRIRIFGPTFSGSLSSFIRLSSTVQNPAGEQQLFTAYSGTVSSSRAIEKQGLPYTCNPKLPCPLVFRTFVHDTESAIRRFVLDAINNGEIQCTQRPEIAILTETNTAYGSAPENAKSPREFMKKQAQSEIAEAPVPDTEKCLTNFLYPREISSLRNAYSSPEGGKGTQAGNAASQQPYLSFNLRDENPNTNDEPPDFSQQQGPVSKEATLMKIAAELHNQHYKYIGVIGTNILDVMFLSSFLRKSYPDARLFVINSDLLFERDLDNVPYIGTVALSTYPLVTRNLDWSTHRLDQQRLPFADQYEEGQYNAAVLTMQEMLAGPDSIVSSTPDRLMNPVPYELPPLTESSRQRDLNLKFDPVNQSKLTPPLWLSVVGTGGYWPIKILYQEKGASPASYSLAQQDFSPGWRSAIALFVVMAFFALAVLFKASPISHFLRDFSAAFDRSGQRLLFLHLCIACLFLGLMMLVAPVCLYGDTSGPHPWSKLSWYVWSMTGTALVFAFLLLLAAVFAHINYLRHKRWLEKQMEQDGLRLENHVWRERFLVWLMPAGWWLGTCAGVVAWWRLFPYDNYYYGFFFAYRVVHFASGVSPIVPMFPLLLAIFLWGVFEMLRLRMDDQFRPRLNAPNFFPGHYAEVPVVQSVSRFLLERKYVLAFLLIFLLWLPFFNPVHPFELFEHYSFGRLFEVMFCAVMAMMLSSACRLNQAWEKLRPLLQELERSRLRMAFTRLKGFGWSPIWKHGGQEGDWINIARSLETIDGISISNAKNQEVFGAEHKTEMSQIGKDIEEIRQKRQNLRTELKQLPYGYSPLLHDLACCMHRIVSRKHDGAQPPESNQSPVKAVYRFQKEFAGIQQGFATLVNRMAGVLPSVWEKNPVELQADADVVEGKATVQHEHLTDQELELQRWENYIALRFVAFIRGALAYMRHAMIFLGLSFSLVLISLNLYSFEPHQTLLWSFTALFVVIGAVIMRVLMQVHRDHILSRITDTKPNEVGWEFYLRMVSVGVVPLLTLLATHFPSIGRGLLSLFQPSLEALK
ncbi:MAG: hypothetical protein DMG65_12780 [Candidatus Angelobacter sp. Gp1-AA117]|nr:MAG: hypothetical protein DMG65_12780 [Candidatus Angelobacter sp. Gp1-AA117]